MPKTKPARDPDRPRTARTTPDPQIRKSFSHAGPRFQDDEKHGIFAESRIPQTPVLPRSLPAQLAGQADPCDYLLALVAVEVQVAPDVGGVYSAPRITAGALDAWLGKKIDAYLDFLPHRYAKQLVSDNFVEPTPD